MSTRSTIFRDSNQIFLGFFNTNYANKISDKAGHYSGMRQHSLKCVAKDGIK
jgi:hypothetical protein